VRRREHHLLEADDVGVAEGAVVDDLAENVLVDLLYSSMVISRRWQLLIDPTLN
jgi:hypothetical protein